ncbi:MAG TPA: septum site-determining protein MinC [Caulobacteraceae bacterium]|nr:septum site-determining protein MinC [Caulobacteraceae bacterium]
MRGRSVLALVVAPEPPLQVWLSALDAQLATAPDFFAGRPVIADLSATHADMADPEPVLAALSALSVRGLKLIGVEGVDAALLDDTLWARLPTSLRGKEAPREVRRSVARPATPARPAAAPACSLVVDRPVRSGQSIVFEAGDVTVIGSVASGAEVVAGGSIHVEGPLRGRAIAGVRAGEAARIFCRRLEAELVAVAGLYRTADDWSADADCAALYGRPAQIRCDGGALLLEAIE